MRYLFLISCLALFLPVFAQKKKSSNTSADRYALEINRQNESGKLIRKSLDEMSIPGGAVTGYYAGTKLVLIKTAYGAE